ncbi:hypothetical protein BMS3Abin10_00165 [bacterium BMS3Abin10]|nr:hypothetical protein BMS3Abin10_00165 [bacterium BMS3Abin10]
MNHERLPLFTVHVFLLITSLMIFPSNHIFADSDKIYSVNADRGDIQKNLQKTVSTLAGEIGSRAYFELQPLQMAADYITSELVHYGYDVSSHGFEFGGNTYSNIIAEIPGKKKPEKVLIIGAHYDTVTGTRIITRLVILRRHLITKE